MGGLTSDRMRRIVQQAAARFDWVLIDTPPVGFLSDANLLVAMVDVAIFVVRAGKSPYRLIQRALDAVGRDRILGVVLNAVAENVKQTVHQLERTDPVLSESVHSGHLKIVGAVYHLDSGKVELIDGKMLSVPFNAPCESVEISVVVVLQELSAPMHVSCT